MEQDEAEQYIPGYISFAHGIIGTKWLTQAINSSQQLFTDKIFKLGEDSVKKISEPSEPMGTYIMLWIDNPLYNRLRTRYETRTSLNGIKHGLPTTSQFSLVRLVSAIKKLKVPIISGLYLALHHWKKSSDFG